jgi:hypothetical protein
MPGYRPAPEHFEVGAVLQHRPRTAGDVSAPPRIVIVGRDDELARWLAVDQQIRLVSVWDVTADMYRRVAPNNFRGRATVQAEGRRLWTRALAGRKVRIRTG